MVLSKLMILFKDNICYYWISNLRVISRAWARARFICLAPNYNSGCKKIGWLAASSLKWLFRSKWTSFPTSKEILNQNSHNHIAWSELQYFCNKIIIKRMHRCPDSRMLAMMRGNNSLISLWIQEICCRILRINTKTVCNNFQQRMDSNNWEEGMVNNNRVEIIIIIYLAPPKISTKFSEVNCKITRKWRSSSQAVKFFIKVSRLCSNFKPQVSSNRAPRMDPTNS